MITITITITNTITITITITITMTAQSSAQSLKEMEELVQKGEIDLDVNWSDEEESSPRLSISSSLPQQSPSFSF
jgi:hypothetical protein